MLIYEFGSVRATSINGEPWLVGKDVAEILGYSRTADAIRAHVDPDDKGVGELETPGGPQAMVIINESGLYSLIFGSKLPEDQRERDHTLRWPRKHHKDTKDHRQRTAVFHQSVLQEGLGRK